MLLSMASFRKPNARKQAKYWSPDCQKNMPTSDFCRLDAMLGCILAITDFSMTYGGPVYVCVGMTLILGTSCLWLTAIYLPVYASQGWPVAAAHLMLGAILLGNVLFNYIMCITTSPGTTAKSVREVGAIDFCLQQHHNHDQSFMRLSCSVLSRQSYVIRQSW